MIENGTQVRDNGAYSDSVGDSIGIVIGYIPEANFYRVLFPELVESEQYNDAIDFFAALGSGARAGSYLYEEDELTVLT